MQWLLYELLEENDGTKKDANATHGTDTRRKGGTNGSTAVAAAPPSGEAAGRRKAVHCASIADAHTLLLDSLFVVGADGRLYRYQHDDARPERSQYVRDIQDTRRCMTGLH